MKKPKFKPVITKIKLNPEQAVLQCDCYRGLQIYTTTVACLRTIGIGTHCFDGKTLAFAGFPFAGMFQTQYGNSLALTGSS